MVNNASSRFPLGSHWNLLVYRCLVKVSVVSKALKRLLLHVQGILGEQDTISGLKQLIRIRANGGQAMDTGQDMDQIHLGVDNFLVVRQGTWKR